MLLPGLLVVLTGGSAPAVDVPHFPTNEDLRHIRSISDPHPSPDGHMVLYRVTESTVDGASAHLWITDVDRNTFRQLTYSPGSDKSGESDGRWMPDGKSILFLAKRGDHRQIFQLPLDGGDAHPFSIKAAPLVDGSKLPNAVPPKPATETHSGDEKLAPVELNIGSYLISPDGKSISVLAADPQTPGELAQVTEKADAEWVDHDIHGTRAFVFQPESAKTTPIPIPANVGHVAWSPDSTQLFVTQSPTDGSEDLAPSTTSWIVDAGSLTPKQLPNLPRGLFSAEWSSDGKSLWFVAQAHRDAPPGYGDLYRYDLSKKSIQNYTDGFAGSLLGGLVPIAGGGAITGAGFGFDAGAVRISPTSTAPEKLSFSLPAVSAFSSNASESAWVYLGGGSTHPTALYYTPSLTQAGKALNTPTLIPSDFQSVASKRIRWKNKGLTIEGELYLPAYAVQHKVPLIVEVHGGPTSAYTDGYPAFVNFLVGKGWAVLRTNPRGSTNYGAAFAAANKNDLGGEDYKDIMAGVDFVLKTESIDPNRMALEGYSYGGEMAGFVEVKTDRFKAIISGAPVIDQFSEFGTESGSYYDRWFYGRPWDHPADVWRQSPISGAMHAKTPFMLLQGQGDDTDPLGQSQEMYRALRQYGVPVELISYPRDNHGVLGGAIYGNPSREPWHGFDARQRMIEFIQKAFSAVKK